MFMNWTNVYISGFGFGVNDKDLALIHLECISLKPILDECR